MKAATKIGMKTGQTQNQSSNGEGKSFSATIVRLAKSHEVEDDWAVVIPAGVEHNLINTSDSEKRKLYSIYSPPEHPEGTVHATKADDTGHDH